MVGKMADFVSSHNGHWYGSGQCYAGTEEYLSWGLGTTVRVPGYATAWQWGNAWRSTVLGQCCKEVSEPKDGDIFFWNNHTCMSYQGKYFGQNQGTDGNGGVFNLMALPWHSPQIILRPNFISNLYWVIPETNRNLSQEEMNNNAKCLYGYLNKVHGWSLQACCGVLGNATLESTINPNMTEYGGGGGYGLVQWTPGSICKSYLNARGAKLEDYGNMECDLINTGNNWYPTKSYSMSFDEFKRSTADPGYLAIAFLANFERPLNPNQPVRGTHAKNWFNYLKDWTPEIPCGASGQLDGATYVNKLQLELINGFVKRACVVSIRVS